MRMVAVIFTSLGFFLLVELLDFKYQFIPFHPVGHEGVVVVAIVTPFLGIAASLLGLIFGFGVIVRGRREKFWWILVTWCCLQILGLITMFIYA
jgi:hypothetical protein